MRLIDGFNSSQEKLVSFIITYESNPEQESELAKQGIRVISCKDDLDFIVSEEKQYFYRKRIEAMAGLF